MALRRRGGVGEIVEDTGHDDDGGDARLLTDDRVVDTPRRARPSSAEADDRGVDPLRELDHLGALLFGPPDA